jgi:hypothetical protein
MYYDKKIEGKSNINSSQTDTKIVTSIGTFDMIIY